MFQLSATAAAVSWKAFPALRLETSGRFQSHVSRTPQQRTKFVVNSIPTALRSRMSSFSHQKLEAQKRREFVSCPSIESASRWRKSGHPAAGSPTGCISPSLSYRRGRLQREEKNPQHKCFPIFISIIFLLSNIFAATTSNITVGTHNLHNFKHSSAYHKSCLQRFEGIWMGQELWPS